MAAELPRLVSRELQCELTDLQEELYDMAEAGLLAKDADPDESPAAVLGAMTFVQESVDAPNPLNNADGEPWEGNSPKIDTLLELLEDELDGVKTIVFSRFERMDEGTVEDSASNDKCVAGAGVFLDTMSRMLRISVGELGPESLKATNTEPLSSTCAIFAESELVSLVHRTPPVPIPNILAGIHLSLINRLFALALRVGMPSEVVMSGGVARNIGIIRAMEAKLGKAVLVPAKPESLGALGAARFAQEGGATC